MISSTKELMTYPDCILNRFPDQTEMIKSLYEFSPIFREICADYLEMFTWIENYSQPENESSNMHHHASELMEELADELMDCLEGRNSLVARESYK